MNGKSFRIRIYLFLFSFLLLLLYACEVIDKQAEDEVRDFRDKYVGSYKGIQLRDYPLMDSLNNISWHIDTTSFDIEIDISKTLDSSLLVRIDEFSFQADYYTNKKFVCSECQSSPWHYVEFSNSDSAYVFQRINNLSSYHYYGKK
jgi:hypothetical protein